jgi:hypothetical protein
MHAKFTSFGIGLGATALALLFSHPAHAQQSTVVVQPAPAVVAAPVRPESTATIPNRALLGTGAVAFTVAYVPSVIVAAASDHNGDNHLYIPVVGPWLDLGNRGCEPLQFNNCGTSTWAGIALVTDGIVQGFGAVNMIASFFIPERTYVAEAPKPQHAHVAFAPTSFGGRGYGAVASGQF